MMTDRELLELAAKAEGHGVEFDERSGLYFLDSKFTGLLWDPLCNDGDALRLAVKLKLTVKCMEDYIKVGWREAGERWPGEEAPSAEEMPAATRRAIVRAAAEIGKGMP